MEILDFEYSINCGDLSFLWDERRSYPSLSHLDYLLTRSGLRRIHTWSFTHANQRFYSVVYDSSYAIQDPLTTARQLNGFPINGLLVALVEKLSRFAHSTPSVSIIGVGHKSLTLASLLQYINIELKIALFDGTSYKIGAVWNGIPIQSFQDLRPGPSETYIFAFNNQLSADIQTSLSTIGSPGITYNVEELLSLDHAYAVKR